MWSRVIEIMLGWWLLMAPFVFAHGREQTLLWINDFVAGAAVITFGLLSHWNKTGRAHLLTLVVALWLLGIAYTQTHEMASAAFQNDAIVGLLLLMFAVVPNHASRPPDSWSKHQAMSNST